MKKFFAYGIAMVALLAGCVAAMPIPAIGGTGTQSSAPPKETAGVATEDGLPEGMAEFPGVTVPDVPGWVVKQIGPVPLTVARQLVEPNCRAVILVMSRPGDVGDLTRMAREFAAWGDLPPGKGTLTLREKLPDGFILSRRLPDGRIGCLAYRALADRKGATFVRVATVYGTECGDAPLKAFHAVARGITKN